jgi:hypothetical protein
MAKEPRLVHTLALGDRASTATATRAREGALNREDELAILGQLGLKDAKIGDVELDGDQRRLGHEQACSN